MKGETKPAAPARTPLAPPRKTSNAPEESGQNRGARSLAEASGSRSHIVSQGFGVCMTQRDPHDDPQNVPSDDTKNNAYGLPS